MLSLTSDRLDYGEQLRAPAGYRLDLGIATTFSLDLEALVAASLALNLDQTLEGDLSGERLALLESLDQLQERLLVFYQRGNVKIPKNFNRLFTLLEPLLAPSVALEGPQGPFASFHPKVWLLRFAPQDSKESTLLRLLVLSRNLTFDRSWDIAVAIDGKALKRGGNSDPRLVSFLQSLSHAEAHAERINSMCKTLAAVDWTLPNGFEKLSMLPGFAESATITGSAPIDLEGTIDELLVVSPFVDADSTGLLQDLAARTRGAKTLISRADTLDAIGKDALDRWSVQSLSELVVDGEERLHKDQPAPQDLHAKLIVAKIGSQAVWHVGSANMTNAAFGKPLKGIPPRNREFMLRLVGRNAKVGPMKLLEEWAATGVFQPHSFNESSSVPPEANQDFRRVVYQLTSATWSIHTKQTADGDFSVELTVSSLPPLPEGYSVTVGLLCRPSMKALATSLVWGNVKLTDVSAFVPVEVTFVPAKVTSKTDGISQRFAIQASFSTDLMDARKRAIFKETVGSGAKLLHYLTLLLDAGASKAKWFCADGDGSDVDIFGLDGRGALYEQLLRATSRAPDRLARALRVFERIRDEEVEIPPGLEELFSGFAAFSGSGRG
jgi:hypothetical protein